MEGQKLNLDSVVQELDKAIEEKKPKGILVRHELYTELQDKGRISTEMLQLVIDPAVQFKHEMLDKKVFVTVSDEWCGKDFYRLPVCNKTHPLEI